MSTLDYVSAKSPIGAASRAHCATCARMATGEPNVMRRAYATIVRVIGTPQHVNAPLALEAARGQEMAAARVPQTTLVLVACSGTLKSTMQPQQCSVR